ncbi:MAG: DUF1540 domain-containing protein [Phycisphaerae bacterium]
MRMPKVRECEIDQCAYNQNSMCHALAITIGDAVNPRCDTFCSSHSKGGDPSETASVGACKVSVCKYNESLECTAEDIEVGRKGDEIDCKTFQQK